jgi:UDP-N-acetylglucosamine enolpyruvyl transferase
MKFSSSTISANGTSTGSGIVVVVEVLVVDVVVGATEEFVLAATLVEDETEISDE